MIKAGCDKCYKIYEPGTHGCGTIVINVYDSYHPSWPGGISRDLCPSCMQKLDKKLSKELNYGD